MNTDYYQITMAYAHWKNKTGQKKSKFQLYYRKAPFGAKSIIACGLDTAIKYLRDFKFSESDLAHLESLKLFELEFLDYLSKIKLSASIKAVLEGTNIAPKEPILQITAPLIESQLLETPLLNIFNFQSLIATKAKLICEAAGEDPVIEFGLRRAHGFDGALLASKAAYVGGCESTSNLEAAKNFDIPVRGTMSHAWVMSHQTEPEAFEAYAKVYPENCVLLVDTYDTINGVRNAVKLSKKLQAIRLDSGNLEKLSHEARYLLNQADLKHTKIIASGDLDEDKIRELKLKKAPIDIWGVGTRLVTAYDEPALTGVYKLACIENKSGQWLNCHKTSNDSFKASLPGLLSSQRNPLTQIFKSGDLIYTPPSIHSIRDAVKKIKLHAA